MTHVCTSKLGCKDANKQRKPNKMAQSKHSKHNGSKSCSHTKGNGKHVKAHIKANMRNSNMQC